MVGKRDLQFDGTEYNFLMKSLFDESLHNDFSCTLLNAEAKLVVTTLHIYPSPFTAIEHSTSHAQGSPFKLRLFYVSMDVGVLF